MLPEFSRVKVDIVLGHKVNIEIPWLNLFCVDLLRL